MATTLQVKRCCSAADPTNPTSFCQHIQRTASGSLAAGIETTSGFTQLNINIGALETEGVDLQVGYAFDAGRHGHNLDYAATFLDQLDEFPAPGVTPIVCAGKFSTACKPPSPEYRHRILYTWQTPWSIDVTTTWRHFDSVDHANNDPLESSLDSMDYIDLSASWYLMDDSLTVRISVLNLFEEETPVSTFAGTGVGNGNAYPTMYDTSTTYFAALKFNF